MSQHDEHKFALHANWSHEGRCFRLDSVLRGGQLSARAKPGDQVIAIDDEEIGGQSMAEVMKRLKGPVGSEVKITFLREGNAEDIEFDALITRTESEFQDVQAAVMYALIPDIEAPAKKNIEDDGNLDSALWNRVTGKINDIKLKALAEEEKVQKLQALVKQQQARIQEGAELLEQKHKEMQLRVQQGLEHLRYREGELISQIEHAQRLLQDKEYELQEEKAHRWWDKLQQLQSEYDEMTLENVRLHSDALAGITITLELDEKHVRTLNGRENRRLYQKQLGHDTCRALKLHSGRIQVIGTRVRANSGAVHVTEAGASLVDFDCQILPQALSPKEPSAMVLAEEITRQASHADSALRRSGNLGARVRRAAQKDPHEFIDFLRSSVLDLEAKLHAYQQSNASRPVTMMEQRGNGNGNSVPSFWNPSLPDPLSYQSPRQTPHSTIQAQSQGNSPPASQAVQPYIESLERQQKYVQEIEAENETLSLRVTATQKENATLQQELQRLRQTAYNSPQARPAYTSPPADSMLRSQSVPADRLRTQLSPRPAADPRAGRIVSPRPSAGVGARRYVNSSLSDDEVAA